VVEDLWRRQTLLHLLQIVELPVLEVILASPGRAPSRAAPPLGPGRQDLVIANTCLERELHHMLNLPRSVFTVSVHS